MRAAIVIAVCVAAVAGCGATGPPARVLRLALPPFDEAPVSFVVAGPRFTPGEVTIVKVCIAADRSILSAAVMASSGDRRFDALAVNWARQVRVRAAPRDGSPVQALGKRGVGTKSPTHT